MKFLIENGYLQWVCPSQYCGGHSVPIDGHNKWNWDGDTEKPTIAPSVRVTWDGFVGQEKKHRCCHFFLQGGVINFCGDCTHELNGKQGVEVPEMES